MPTSTCSALRRYNRANRLASVLLIGVLSLAGAPAQAAFLSPGDIVVADISTRQLYRVDPVTGDRTVLSGDSRGSGPEFTLPASVSQNKDGTLLVSDHSGARLLRVDPNTGDRVMVSQHPYFLDETEVLGDGPFFVLPLAEGGGVVGIASVALSADGEIVVVAQSGLFRVDGITGDRTMISGGGFGSGPMFAATLTNLRLGSDGAWYVADAWGGDVYRIDPATGDRDIVAAFPAISILTGLAFEADGSLLTTRDDHVFPESQRGIFRVDPLTGDSAPVPGGEGLTAFNLDWLPSGKLVLTSKNNTIQVFDLETGEQSTLSGNGIGSGPSFVQPFGLLVYVPEPSSLAMAGLGAVLAGIFAVRRTRRA